MNFHQLQHEVGVWAKKNFPNETPTQVLLGVMEELGELSHSQLKMDQNIRMNEPHHENKIDAIGDIIVYLAHYCELSDISLGLAVSSTWDKVKQRDWQTNPNDADKKVDA